MDNDKELPKPDKIKVGQRWKYMGDAYQVMRRDGELWVTNWEPGEHRFSSDAIMQDTFLGYADGYTAPAPAPEPTTGQQAAEWLRGVAKVLEQKSIAYGDSVGQPLRIFSHVGVTEGVRVRIDDKLSRVARGNDWPGDDVVVDLVGYLALLAVTEKHK